MLSPLSCIHMIFNDSWLKARLMLNSSGVRQSGHRPTDDSRELDKVSTLIDAMVTSAIRSVPDVIVCRHLRYSVAVVFLN